MEQDNRITEFYRFALQSDDIDDLCEKASLMLGSPLCILDNAMHLITSYPRKEMGNPVGDSIIRKGYLDKESANQLFSNDAASDSQEVATAMPSGRFISIPLAQHSTATIIRFEKNAAGEHQDDELVDAVSLAISNALNRSIASERPGNATSRLARFLLHESDSDNEQARSFFKELGFQSDGSFVALYAAFPPESTTLAPYWEWLLSEEMKGLFTHTGAGVMGFFEVVDPLEEEMEKLDNPLVNLRLSCGTSNIFSDLADLPRQIDEAKRTLELGLLLDPGKEVYEYADYATQLFFSSQPVQDYVIAHREPRVVILEEYDSLHGTSYCNDLYNCFSNFNNISRAAKASFMHRNTLNYHIEQIMVITGADLNNPSVCFAMFIDLAASRIRRLSRSIRR